MYKETSHKRPHIHIDYGPQNHVASYAIDTGMRLSGNLHRKYDQAVRDWIGERKADLVTAWELMQAGKPTENVIAQLQGNV